MKIFILPLLLGVFSTVSIASTVDDWSNVTEPTSIQLTPPQSIGKYDAGCISGAVRLPLDGTGYQVMRLSRKRYYGHPNLIQFIQNLGLAANNQKLGTLLIGDLGQPRGGPTHSGHRSHQTGLDVDIWFLLSPEAAARKLEANARENWSAVSVLLNQSDDIDPKQWSNNHVKILEAASNSPEVDRIFVNPSVKRELCKNPANHAWLKKIRPWWKHDDHLHVRLKCPDDSRNCDAQSPLPEGSGCDSGLNWWFSYEAKHPTKKAPPSVPSTSRMPKLCESVLKQNTSDSFIGH